VYLDNNANGVKDAGDTGVSTTVTLTGTDAFGNAVSLTTTSGADGSYSFAGLMPSNAGGYTVSEPGPLSYLEGQANVGSLGGTASNSDTITSVVVSGGSSGINYNFGEVQPASLTVTKTADAASVNSTDAVGFTIVVSNTAGAGTAYGVVLSDTLPAGLTWTASAGTINSGVLTDAIGNLAAGGSVSVHVGAVTPSGYSATLENTATATPTNGAPASGSGMETVLAPHLTITKSGNGTINSSDTARFTITVSNTGAGTAYSVSLNDPLPDSAHLTWTSDAGTIGGGTLTDAVGSLAAGGSVTIHVSAVTPAAYSATLRR
jgi:uncharacterized repeat protein (TIGR01451 family)